ncbi:MAG TPA: 50S ribosomal protein L23 [Planctomycetaceae bacterium]|nr:50S ribosomal protein L23 [Planctomycetaceae bacterium]
MPKQKDRTQTKLKLEPYQVVLRPIVTEKGFHFAEKNNVYSFEVNPLANKGMIREAVEHLFDVKVLEVKVQNRQGKTRRMRHVTGKLKSWKKAMVKLHPDSRINYF